MADEPAQLTLIQRWLDESDGGVRVLRADSNQPKQKKLSLKKLRALVKK